MTNGGELAENIMKNKKKKLKHFEIEFGSMTYRRYDVKAECLQTAKLIAWQDMETDKDSSWHWKNGAQLTYSEELGKNEDIPF